jgi:hydrogenase expression/formation protein HypC
MAPSWPETALGRVIQITPRPTPQRYNKVAMCLAIPGKVEAISHDGLIRTGRVNFGGVVKNVCLDYVPEVEVGDYTIVHVGFAISKIDEATAEQTLADFRALGMLQEELASEEEAFARAAQRPQSNCPDGSCSNEDSGAGGVSGAKNNNANTR